MRLSVAAHTLVLAVLFEVPASAQRGPGGRQSAGVDQCIPLLKAQDPITGAAGADCARKLGPAGAPAIPYLIEMLPDESVFYWDGEGPDGRMEGGSASRRQSAAAALAAMGDAGVLGLIEALGRHKDARVRGAAAQFLGTRDDARALDPLIAAFADRPVRAAAVQALVRMTKPGIGDRLFARLTDKNPAIRDGVLSALVGRKDARVASLLLERLRSGDQRTRVAAATQLGAFGSVAAVDALIHALRDRALPVRRAAADALGSLDYRSPAASPARARALDALDRLERQTRNEYTKRTNLDARTEALMRLAEHAFDAKRKIAGEH